MTWPTPWPEPPRAADGPASSPGPVPDAARYLIGASDHPATLVGDAVRVPITIDDRVARSLRTDKRAADQQHRAFLDIEDIEAGRNPGRVYGVYLNLPDQPTDADLATHHVGNISLFGVERARNPRGDQQPHGLHVSMEITSLLDELAAGGSWTDGRRLEVTLRPITLQPPADRDDLARNLAVTAHPDVPITIGRISVHYA